jgi:hypothetical protein
LSTPARIRASWAFREFGELWIFDDNPLLTYSTFWLKVGVTFILKNVSGSPHSTLTCFVLGLATIFGGDFLKVFRTGSGFIRAERTARQFKLAVRPLLLEGGTACSELRELTGLTGESDLEHDGEFFEELGDWFMFNASNQVAEKS